MSLSAFFSSCVLCVPGLPPPALRPRALPSPPPPPLPRSPRLGRLTALQNLQLYSNPFNTTLPTELGLLTSCTFLDIRYGLLSGTLPTTIGNMAAMKWFDVVSSPGRALFPLRPEHRSPRAPCLAPSADFAST